MKNNKIKILFLAIHRPERSPSQRFRFEQYIDYLNENGFNCDQKWLINEKEDKFFYKPGNIFKKALVMLKGALINFRVLLSAKKWDIIFIQREAYFLGTTFFERAFSKKTKLVFDFDDSIWLQNVSDANKKFAWLKNAEKTKELIQVADLIFAGNPYLAEYAIQFNEHVKIVPTTIDTSQINFTYPAAKDKVCIGWTGSMTTIQHFEFAIPFLRKIKEKYGDKVYFKVIGDGNYVNKELDIHGLPWKKESELKDISEMDIGIMPLPDDEWARGKCGLKGLQYMSMGIPTIMSPVGVNSEIIQDGKNGYLASGIEEWEEKLTRLIEDAELRKNIGAAGKATVEAKYSTLSQQQYYLKYLNELVQS